MIAFFRNVRNLFRPQPEYLTVADAAALQTALADLATATAKLPPLTDAVGTELALLRTEAASAQPALDSATQQVTAATAAVQQTVDALTTLTAG